MSTNGNVTIARSLLKDVLAQVLDDYLVEEVLESLGAGPEEKTYTITIKATSPEIEEWREGDLEGDLRFVVADYLDGADGVITIKKTKATTPAKPVKGVAKRTRAKSSSRPRIPVKP